jgi:hypothetical protein
MVIENSVLIAVMWERDVLHAFNLFPGQRFVLGQAPGAWPFPPELIGARSMTLVDYTGKLPRWCPTGCALEPGQRVAAVIGRFRILARAETGERVDETWRPSHSLDRTIAYFGASAAAWLTALLVTYHAVPPLTDTDPLPFSRELVLDLQGFENAAAEPEADEPPANPASDVFPTIHALMGFSRCGGDVDMGTKHDPRVARYGIQGPADNPDPRLSRWRLDFKPEAHTHVEPGLLAPWQPEDSAAPSAPWGRDYSLGTDEVSARGNMWGDDIDKAPGDEESMGITHVDGGQIKVIDVERAPSVARPPRVVHAQLQVDGPLPAAAIEQALVSKLESFRDCYRADPASSGDHEGRIDVKISIDSEGKAGQSDALRADNVMPTTTECILDKVTTSTFAAASSATEVVYPLLLIPGERQTPQAVARLDLAPPIARSNEAPIPCSGSTRRHPKTQGQCNR